MYNVFSIKKININQQYRKEIGKYEAGKIQPDKEITTTTTTYDVNSIVNHQIKLSKGINIILKEVIGYLFSVLLACVFIAPLAGGLIYGMSGKDIKFIFASLISAAVVFGLGIIIFFVFSIKDLKKEVIRRQIWIEREGSIENIQDFSNHYYWDYDEYRSSFVQSLKSI